MKKIIALFLIATFLLVGCAKKSPEAAAPVQPSAPSSVSVGQATPGAASQQEVKPVGDERCMDTDGGANYAVKGKIYGINDFGVKYEKEDACITGKDYLNEYFCSETGKPQTDVHKCANGCKEGVCI